MELFNLYQGELQARDNPQGWHSARVHLGGDQMGMSVYDLAPGERTWPYHFELAEEEWVLVVTGEPTLRDPEGEQQLRPGDVVCFPPGPEGAHLLRNDTDAPVRLAMFSDVASAADGAVYPDSDKVVMRGPGWSRRMRLGDEVDYWDGE